MKEHQKKVHEFVKKMRENNGKEPIPKTPQFPKTSIRSLCVCLILEEALEVFQALGISVDLNIDHYNTLMVELQKLSVKDDFLIHGEQIEDIKNPEKLGELSDGLADLIYVAIYTAIVHGIDLSPIMKAVEDSNLEKFRGDSHLDSKTGKWIKPSDWQAPDFAKMIADQME